MVDVNNEAGAPGVCQRQHSAGTPVVQYICGAQLGAPLVLVLAAAAPRRNRFRGPGPRSRHVASTCGLILLPGIPPESGRSEIARDICIRERNKRLFYRAHRTIQSRLLKKIANFSFRIATDCRRTLVLWSRRLLRPQTYKRPFSYNVAHNKGN